MLSLQDPTRVLKNLLGTSLKMYSTTGCSMSQKNTRLNWMHCRMGQFSFPKENRNCGWQKPRCSVHLHVEGPVIMSWPRHPEASHSLSTHPGDLVGLARLLGNEQTCAETRGFPPRGAEP